MLTQEQVLEAARNGRKTDCLDGRDYGRLVDFFPVSDWETFGFKLKDGEKTPEPPKPWTLEAILEQLRYDVAFGFEKALNQRGISASMMHSVVLMWMWVLEDSQMLAMEDHYAQYGLPLFKAVAIKYGFENPIGEDSGSESKYEESYG